MHRPNVILGSLLAAALSGCVINAAKSPVVEPQESSGKDGAATAQAGASFLLRYRTHFPKTVDSLLHVEDLIAAGKANEALAALNETTRVFEQENGAAPSAVSEGGLDEELAHDLDEARRVLPATQATIRVTAMMMTGDPYGALGVLANNTASGGCDGPIEDACTKAQEDIKQAFQGIWLPFGSGLDISSSGIIDQTIDTGVMGLVDESIARKKAENYSKYVVFVYPQQVSAAKDGGLHLSWLGKPVSWLREECSQVGTLKIEDVTFDVSRCKDVPTRSAPAAVSLDVPAEDAALVKSRKKGEMVGVVLDVSNHKKSGNSWSLGTGRAFFVGRFTQRTH
ncbi:MAG: hypothetical protein R3B13_05215 [Polyangiaceae bacterium]